MNNGQIYVLMEPACQTSTLYKRSLEGLQRAASVRGLKVRLFYAPREEDVRGAQAGIIISATSRWTVKATIFLSKLGVKPILVGASVITPGVPFSCPTLDRAELVSQQVNYLIQAGRTRIASVGNQSNDINDVLRRQAFHISMQAQGNEAAMGDVFTANDGITSCLARFFAQAGQYDAALCVNDVVAVELIRNAPEHGVRIPDDLYVMGSGNYLVGRLIRPALSTSTLDYHLMGSRSVDIWAMHCQDPGIQSIRITLPFELIVRESTGMTPAAHWAREPDRMPPQRTRLRDVREKFLHSVEGCLTNCDNVDLLILQGVLTGESNEHMATRLFVSAGTINYRLKHLYRAVGVQTKSQLAQQLSPYIPDISALDGMLAKE